MDARVHAADRSQPVWRDAPLQRAIDVDTSVVPHARQFDLFRSWNEDVCEFEPVHDRFQSFPARQTAWDLGTMAALRLGLPGEGSRYRWRHLKRAKVDNWYVLLPLSGDRNGGDRRRAARPVIKSLAEPFEYVGEDDGCVALIMPSSLPFIRSSSVAIRDEASMLLADFMLLLDRSLPNLRATDVPHIVGATTSLLAACLTLSRDHLAGAQQAIDSVIVDRASRIIERKLADPDLTPQKLCRDLGVARSGLYRIFEPVGGISNFIRRRRLLRTCDILADRSDQRPISTIAHDWGFSDPSAYSRMFRKEFGMTPKEARAEGWCGRQPAPMQQGSLPDGKNALGNLLLRNCFASGSGRPLVVANAD
ncbi:helix-turn-helix domain-containing protein [Aminobacter sp. NyZ550]|uniref:helix-turn-helix domain-containing protein n=1 Tax=Aminobacter sp. NyZ550 TaxID=2979870 RepID=UPI0021D5BCA3|nr:helix-turn-helix domain-containing protein [Aminobacter sp. NyZ550]WAX93992.1 helix-turn-helix domain-containing protein [Aminobacter sp. NyZ550]